MRCNHEYSHRLFTDTIISRSSVTLIVVYGCAVLHLNLDIARMMIAILPCQSIFQHHCGVVVPNSSILLESTKPVMSLFTRSDPFSTIQTHLRGSGHSPLSLVISHLSGPLSLPYGLANFNDDWRGCPKQNLGLPMAYHTLKQLVILGFLLSDYKRLIKWFMN